MSKIISIVLGSALITSFAMAQSTSQPTQAQVANSTAGSGNKEELRADNFEQYKAFKLERTNGTIMILQKLATCIQNTKKRIEISLCDIEVRKEMDALAEKQKHAKEIFMPQRH